MYAFSKSFGYALRGILYVAATGNTRKRIQVDEIACNLSVPKHFLSKIMKTVVKNEILNSTKGPYGGFSLNDKTLSTTLITLIHIMNGAIESSKCALLPGKCNAANPCPMHNKMDAFRKELFQVLTCTTIGDLLNAKNPDFIKSITTA